MSRVSSHLLRDVNAVLSASKRTVARLASDKSMSKELIQCLGEKMQSIAFTTWAHAGLSVGPCPCQALAQQRTSLGSSHIAQPTFTTTEVLPTQPPMVTSLPNHYIPAMYFS